MNTTNIPYGNQYSDLSEKKPAESCGMTLAMAYVPAQQWETPYDVMDGLDRGTLFPGLDKPFLGGGSKK